MTVGTSSFASEDTVVPASVRQLASGDRITPVWINGDGGVTFQIGAGSSRRFAKWVPAHLAPLLVAEASRLRWAIDFVRVPRLLDNRARLLRLLVAHRRARRRVRDHRSVEGRTGARRAHRCHRAPRVP